MCHRAASPLQYTVDKHVMHPQNLHELHTQKYTARSSTVLQLPSLCCRLQAVVKKQLLQSCHVSSVQCCDKLYNTFACSIECQTAAGSKLLTPQGEHAIKLNESNSSWPLSYSVSIMHLPLNSTADLWQPALNVKFATHNFYNLSKQYSEASILGLHDAFHVQQAISVRLIATG